MKEKERPYKGDYPVSKKGNFFIVDTIGVPHPYCITPKHVGFASDHCGGILNPDAIRAAEKQGAKCDICKKSHQDLSYDEHETALVVACEIEIKPVPDELFEWLLSIKEEASKNNYAGFAFRRRQEGDENS